MKMRAMSVTGRQLRAVGQSAAPATLPRRPHLPPLPADPEVWAEQTRRVLTRDLLVRARHCPPGEARALQFRAVHLNLPLIGEVAEALGLSSQDREAAEHHALDGLVQAVRLYDPWAAGDFATFATLFIREQILANLARGRKAGARRRSLARRGQTSAEWSTMRLVVRRAAQAMAGYHA